MLLYSRVVAPKAPKRRSRGGCLYCKTKKKKCDEAQPRCSRCVEHRTECTYEPTQGRQKRRRTNDSSPPVSPAFQRPRVAHDDVEDEAACYDFGSAGHSAEFIPGDEHIATPVASTVIESNSHTPPASKVDVDVGFASTSRAPSLAMISPYRVASPTFEFLIPAFSEFSEQTSRRGLVDHFCNVLSHLIVFKEASGNPFQQLVLPMSQRCSPVMNAIYALASAHMEFRGVKTEEESSEFHNKAVHGLAEMIQQGTNADKNQMLAAVMLLVYYEVLVQKGRSNFVDRHLKGALTVLCLNSQPLDAAGAFLERAFGFYDVIGALSWGTAPLSAPPLVNGLPPLPSLEGAWPDAMPFIDPLLGMAGSLWPLIHRLSAMRGIKQEIENDTLAQETATQKGKELKTSCKAIEKALLNWAPTLPKDFDLERATDFDAEIYDSAEESPAQARLHCIFHNAMAYRHSALIHLYRSIRGLPRAHGMVQIQVHTALIHCHATCSHDGPNGALLWPLFVGACDAISEEDRNLTERAFKLVIARQGMVNIERAWTVVQEVWRRVDSGQDRSEGATGELWRTISQEMGINLVFG